MAFINEYPYSDFNEYNLDWVITHMRDLLTGWAEMREEWSGVKTDWEAMTEDFEKLGQDFIDFKDYVTHYLQNLDIQDEVNHKIDEMAAAGYFSNLFVELFTDDIEAKAALTTTTWLAANITEPEGVVIDTSLTVAGACADAKATGDAIDYIKTELEEAEVARDVDFTGGIEGYFILASNGNLAASGDFNISPEIEIYKGETLNFHGGGYLTNVAMVSKVVGATYVPLVTSETGHTDYTYTATEDMTIVLSYIVAIPPYAMITYPVQSSINAMKTELDGDISDLAAITTTVATEFVDNSEKMIGKQAQGNADHTQVSLSNGPDGYVVAKALVTDQTKARICCYASTDQRWTVGYFCAKLDGTIISQFNDTAGEYTVTIDIPSGTEVIYANNNNHDTSPYVELLENVIVNAGYTRTESDAMYDKRSFCDLSIFEKFGVVGDSYASGELYYGGSYHDKYFNSWGQVMARKHGTTCTNYSGGGLTTRSWLTSAYGLSLVNSSDPEDIYYLALGINDVYSLGIGYLGDITDITSHGSYTEYGDTFYGNYGKIIEQILLHAPHAKLVMFTCAATTGYYPDFNDAIIEIAEHYNIPYIVQADDDFFTSDVYLDMEGGHPTSIAYSGMAVAFERLLNKCIVDNLSYFRDLYMYD